jgi:hypothetical protein
MPRWGEHLLALLIDAQDSDALLGDFAEEYAVRARSFGYWKASLWYSGQIAGSSVSLVWLRLHHWFERREHMKDNFGIWDRRFIGIGLLALLPALLVVVPGVLQSGLGLSGPNDGLDAAFNRLPVLRFLIHPAVLLGGLLVAFALNALPALGLHWERNPEGLSATVTFKNHWLHWTLVGLSLLMLATILAYSVTENFIITPR